MQITDEKLYALCKKYGFQAKLWRQKFIGLLPEVNRRKLYERKGFSSVFEFAFKLAGLSAEQVRLALNLERRFEDKPVLKQMFEDGEASINKLTRVVSIATPENEEDLAAKIKVLPRNALETLVRDEKYAQNENARLQVFKENLESENGLQKPPSGITGLHVQTFQLADDVTKELNDLHSKGIDVNEFLREMLKQRQEKIAEKKQEIAKDIQLANKFEPKASFSHQVGAPVASRYIPMKIKKILQEEYGTKCSIPTCQKPAAIIHHTQRFSLSQNHDPRFMAPLCREHHIIAHSMDAKYHRIRHTTL